MVRGCGPWFEGCGPWFERLSAVVWGTVGRDLRVVGHCLRKCGPWFEGLWAMIWGNMGRGFEGLWAMVWGNVGHGLRDCGPWFEGLWAIVWGNVGRGLKDCGPWFEGIWAVVWGTVGHGLRECGPRFEGLWRVVSRCQNELSGCSQSHDGGPPRTDRNSLHGVRRQDLHPCWMQARALPAPGTTGQFNCPPLSLPPLSLSSCPSVSRSPLCLCLVSVCLSVCLSGSVSAFVGSADPVCPEIRQSVSVWNISWPTSRMRTDYWWRTDYRWRTDYSRVTYWLSVTRVFHWTSQSRPVRPAMSCGPRDWRRPGSGAAMSAVNPAAGRPPVGLPRQSDC